MRLWLLALVLAIVTYKLGWDLLSIPLTIGVIGAGFFAALVDEVRSRTR